ncbi:MAG: hypothetical protein CMD69_00385 [Gammaproteobacteria bacterium]|nr:hypothetical protein [Gammaproteobacteria bacterium]
MIYILLTISCITIIFYIFISRFAQGNLEFDRRQENINLFKKEKNHLKADGSLSKELLDLLVREREQSLLQDVPKERVLNSLSDNKNLSGSFLLSIFMIISMSMIYFQPIGLGSIDKFEIHKELYAFLDGDINHRALKRKEFFIEVKNLLDKKLLSASEIYFLSRKFRDIKEFDFSAVLLTELVIEYKNEIPSNVYGEYAQSTFFKEKEQFSEETIKALNLALIEAPKDPLVLTLEGVKYFRNGNLELAKSSWEEAKGYLKTEEEKAVLQVGIDRLKNQ